MSLTRLVKADTGVDISQTIILERFSQYLNLKNRDTLLISRMKDSGYCMGFTVLAMYAMYLELTRPLMKGETAQRDDWRWLKSAYSRLSRWDGSMENLNKKSGTGRKLRRDTERLISLIEYIQQSNNYEPSSQMRVHNKLIAANGLRFVREYTLAGIFNKNDFIKSINIQAGVKHENRNTLLIDELIKENRLVYLSCVSHVVGIIKNNNQYFYYNSNSCDGWEIYSRDEIKLLLDAVFEGNFSDDSNELPLSINVFRNHADRAAKYPAQMQLLHAVDQSDDLKSKSHPEITALYLAADIGCRNSLRYHLKRQPVKDLQYVNMASHIGQTPLHAAAREGFDGVIMDLIEAGANVNVLDDTGWTPLICAANSGYLSTVKILLENNADPNLSETEYFTPLDSAVSKGNIELTRLLFEYQANANSRTCLRITPLHRAVQNNRFDIADLLFENGAEINVKDKYGSTPFNEAMEYLHFDMMEYLLQKPGIKIDKIEYENLDKLASQYSQDARIQQCLLKAQPLYLLSIIRQQLSHANISQCLHKKAFQMLRATCKQIKKDDLSPEKQMTLLLENMLPLFNRISLSLKKSLWFPPDLAEPIIKFANRVNIHVNNLGEAEYKRTVCTFF